MTKLTYILLGLALAGLAACTDLSEQLVGNITTQYFASGAGLDAAVMGDYSLQRGFWGTEQSLEATEFGTDLGTTGDQPGYKYLDTYAGGMNPSNDAWSVPWNAFYRAINSSNAVVNRAPAITDMDPTTKATRIGEAKFLRALDYFMLVRMFGSIPLSTTESQGVITMAHRTPVDSVYLQIVQDLRDAIKVLPVSQNNFGRATKGAAQALLAKVLLTRAYHPYPYEQASGVVQFLTSPPNFLRESGASSATDFTQAEAEADSVIPVAAGGLGLTGSYSLLVPYVANFCKTPMTGGPGNYCLLPSSESNAELIWSVQQSTTAGQFAIGGGNIDFVFFLSLYDDLQGMERDCNNGREWRRGRPTMHATRLWQRFTDSTYATTLDTRYDGTFQSVWYANATTTGACYQTQAASRLNGYTIAAGNCPAELPKWSNTGCTINDGVAFKLGDTAVFQPGYIVNGVASCTGTGGACSQAFRQSKRYFVLEPQQAEPAPNVTAIGQYDFRRYPSIKKFNDDQRPDFNNQDGGRDVVILRLGGVLLDAAEAACAAGYNSATCTGSQQNILKYITPLRLRAADCVASHGCSAATRTANQTMIMDANHMPATITLEWLLDERGREQIGEYQRWFDLARTGLLHRVPDYNFEASPAYGGFFTVSKHALRPIPQTQIDNTAGGVSAFPQNPGY
ncbi:MAG: RagB/SusD family nutrient uptake outer membrane protein [Gemmatimonadales bacterium]|jgi:hypothetical protein